MLASWRSMTKIVWSGSISQKHGSEDPDPDPPRNVMDPQHCNIVKMLKILALVLLCTPKICLLHPWLSFGIRIWIRRQLESRICIRTKSYLKGWKGQRHEIFTSSLFNESSFFRPLKMRKALYRFFFFEYLWMYFQCKRHHRWQRHPVLRIRIRDPGLGPFWPLDPGSQTHIFESLVTTFWVKSSIILWNLAQIFFLSSSKIK